MRTIRQQEEISFNAISIKDAMVMYPMMLALKKDILSEKSKWSAYDSLKKEEAIAVYKLLVSLGFSSGDDDFIDNLSKEDDTMQIK